MISVRRYFSSSKSGINPDPMLFIDDVYRYALARTGSKEDAEDIAIEVVQQAPNKSDTNELRMYMIGMVRRKLSDHYRQLKPSPIQVEPHVTTEIDQGIDVQRVLDNVSENHRECLILKYVTGLTSEEIATVMETTTEAVDSLLQRARKAFAKEWEIMHGDEDGR